MLTLDSPSSPKDAEEASKSEGFLKSVWHRFTEKNGDSSKSSQEKDIPSKDSEKPKDSKDADKDSSKKS